MGARVPQLSGASSGGENQGGPAGRVHQGSGCSISALARYPPIVQASPFDEIAFFRAIAQSGARALLIGRRALIALGMPVMTSGYDFWIAGDDVVMFNDALSPFGMVPTRSPAEARAHGRYVLENDEHVDVLVARAVSTIDGAMVKFDEVWGRRVRPSIADGVTIAMPCIDDLILTKRFGGRPRDADDIRWLERLRVVKP
jgi:hypothetical protein